MLPASPEPLRVYSTVYTSRGTNLFGVNHPDIDKFIWDSEAELDADERWRIQADLAKFIYENVLSMPLYAENAVWPLSSEVDSWGGCSRRAGLAELLGDATASPVSQPER